SVLIGGLLIIVYIPGSLLLRPLETRFPLWRPVTTDQVVGVVLLGGFHLDSYVRQRLEIHPGLSERVMETARLSKFYPEARILYSGGGMEAPLVKKVLIRLGVDEQKVIIEDQSQSTVENARFSKMVAAPKQSGKWLLVTSAFHMPRAIG